MEELKERIKYIRKSLFKGSQAKFALELGVNEARVKSIENDRVKELSAVEAVKLVNNFNLSPDWLLYGQGKMLQNNNLPVAQEQHPDEDRNTVALNFYPDIFAAAGYGAINESHYEPQIMNFDRKFLEEFLNVRNFSTIDIIKVVGDSMEPYIQDGQTVLIERQQEAKNGETVIANVNGHIYIKRFHTDPFNKWVKLISENETYGDISLNTPQELESFSIVGIVRAKIKVF